MSASAGPPPPVRIPRWVQLVGLPLLLVLVWIVAARAAHVIVLFLIAALIALLLDPIVRTFGRARIRRGFAVAIVYLTFLAAIVVALAALGTVVVSQTKSAANRFNDYFSVPRGQTQSQAYRDVDRLQVWLNTHHLRSLKVEASGHRIVMRIQKRDVGRYTHRVVTFVEGAAVSVGKALFDTALVIVVSIYMLLGLERFGRSLDRRFPPHGHQSLLLRVEHSLMAYVRGQLLLSLIIGASVALGLYILGVTGLLPNGETYALVFGGWAALTEVLPYVGPWLGAIPPLLYALVVHPVSAIWVGILFVGIHQLEGHIVVPNVMGSALQLHPLLVIFGLLAGSAFYGLGGALLALPVLAVGRATWQFFGERIVFEPWSSGGTIPVEVEPVEPPSPAAAPAAVPDPEAETVVRPAASDR
jgi:predicted PurR-regulated permease PerM